MSDIQIFRNEQFGEVRTFAESDGKVTFCAADVATALGYSDTAKAIKQHCKEDGWAFHPVIDSILCQQPVCCSKRKGQAI